MKFKIAALILILNILALGALNHLYEKEIERHYRDTKDIIGMYCWPFVPSKMLK